MDHTKSLIDEVKRLNNENLIYKNLIDKLTQENQDLKKENTNLYNKLFPESNKLAFPPEKL